MVNTDKEQLKTLKDLKMAHKMKFEAFDLRKVRPLLLKIAKEKGKTYEEVKKVFYEKIEVPTREKIPEVIEEVFSD